MTADHLRLCFRIDGTFWNAYAAPIGTLEGAILLGSISIGLLEKPERRDAFKALIFDGYADLLQGMTGLTVEYLDEQPAPEHERTKS